ncbi:MAG: alpha/beta hydrolase [Tractidigestivibacter sp.]|jgi:acetyl esterase/lipase|uniref:alpha/beta hydrolase n=1 Tax=Tractidigestivibacter sp. TaxID=2847320 RepID=UPI003D8FAC11
MSIFKQKPRVIDCRDPKWAHPEDVPNWNKEMEDDVFGYYDDPNMSMEEKREHERQFLASMPTPQLGDDVPVKVSVYDVPGCPEEPDTPAQCVVIRPNDVTSKKAPVIFNIPGGGMYVCVRSDAECADYAMRHHCVTVQPLYRTALQGQYPAALNDVHASYAWMVDNAETLGIDPDRVVIMGLSSGAHLATCLPFRIMPLGYSPRGIVAVMPMCDDRGITMSSRMTPGMSNYREAHKMFRRYLGDRNLAYSVLSPEAFANQATVDDCIGYPPIYFHVAEFDTERDGALLFANKVLQAQSFCEIHEWGGINHVAVNYTGQPMDVIDHLNEVVNWNLDNLIKYDLRRPWVYEDEQ